MGRKLYVGNLPFETGETELQELFSRMRPIARVSEAVVSAHYVDEILQLIVTVTAELMGSKICSLMLLDASAARAFGVACALPAVSYVA